MTVQMLTLSLNKISSGGKKVCKSGCVCIRVLMHVNFLSCSVKEEHLTNFFFDILSSGK